MSETVLEIPGTIEWIPAEGEFPRVCVVRINTPFASSWVFGGIKPDDRDPETLQDGDEVTCLIRRP